MSTIAEQQCHVKESLFQFIEKNIPSADVSAIDDIVLSYVISILEEASQDPCFDVEGFIEMMAAYVPKFASIDPGLVCSWVLELEAELSRKVVSDTASNHENSGVSDKICLTLQNLSEMLPVQSVTKKNRSHSNSENSDGSESNERHFLLDPEEYAEQCRALHDMFPNTCAMEIKHCVSIACGDPEHAAATLLHRLEQGLALPAVGMHAAAKPPKCDNKEVKSRIIARYSYVDQNSGKKEHKPLAPKFEPKKMVRYRDNKIVSLKGERYTEVPKSGADEENLKKPKKQHCP